MSWASIAIVWLTRARRSAALRIACSSGQLIRSAACAGAKGDDEVTPEDVCGGAHSFHGDASIHLGVFKLERRGRGRQAQAARELIEAQTQRLPHRSNPAAPWHGCMRKVGEARKLGVRNCFLLILRRKESMLI